MEPVLQFLGGYWWLAFPLIGVLGGVGRAWERAARQRHKRRLEIIQAKSGLALASPTQRRPVDDGSGSQAAQLGRLFAAHDAVTARWLEYELDVAKLIAFPAMSDGRQPLTAAFLRAKKVADGLRPDDAKTRVTAEQLAEYRDAVTDYEVAFDVAERDARRIRDSSFTGDERRRLDTAQQLLKVAVDQAATPAERQLAYRRVRQELDGLISLSDDAIVRLEERVALELTAGSRPRDDEDAVARPSSSAGDARPGASAGPPAREPKTGQSPAPGRDGSTAAGRVTRAKPRP